MQTLIDNFFKQMPLFKEAYEIVLNSQEPKYSRLQVQMGSIQLTIPVAAQCPPLEEARCIGEAKCLTFEEQGEQE